MLFLAGSLQNLWHPLVVAIPPAEPPAHQEAADPDSLHHSLATVAAASRAAVAKLRSPGQVLEAYSSLAQAPFAMPPSTYPSFDVVITSWTRQGPFVQLTQPPVPNSQT